jgi:hypothetical protein
MPESLESLLFEYLYFGDHTNIKGAIVNGRKHSEVNTVLLTNSSLDGGTLIFQLCNNGRPVENISIKTHWLDSVNPIGGNLIINASYGDASDMEKIQLELLSPKK